jgi:hypothetical protein
VEITPLRGCDNGVSLRLRRCVQEFNHGRNFPWPLLQRLRCLALEDLHRRESEAEKAVVD